MPNEIRFYI